MRYVVDMDENEKSYFQLECGNSGNVFSKFYDNFAGNYRKTGYYEIFRVNGYLIILGKIKF